MKSPGGTISTGFISWSNGAPRLGGAAYPGQADSLYRKQCWSRQMMVEKSAFTAPPAADVARRAISTFARYREPSHYRSIFEIAVTLVPFVALWALAWAAVHFGYWELSFLLGVPAAGCLVRLFVARPSKRQAARSLQRYLRARSRAACLPHALTRGRGSSLGVARN